ncbi:coiled-coil domain-containing protein 32 isoform X2 [Xiphophorus couchianus]|uniref:coiled-coil domain-containing protein 32 isoform X2 n=1 Tax=Xiphophorus couchianus TaxID=32473 RepID=UPI0010169D36|nr:coiled-coil domain-containing protein 32 isoform X2 [Xiphophorus couchianus]
MVDNFDGQDVQTSGELWSQICSSLPEVQAPETSPEFTDSFHPAAHHEVQAGAQVNGTSSPSAQWKPMEDSESYLASLENRLRKIKGQSSDVTSRDILRSLSQAKKECWDRFLHDAQTSELFQSDDMDESNRCSSQCSGAFQEVADPREGGHKRGGAGVSPEADPEYRTDRISLHDTRRGDGEGRTERRGGR